MSKQILLLINLFYIAFVPVLAMLVQGGLMHDFLLGVLPRQFDHVFLGFSYLYPIVMIMLLSQLVNAEESPYLLFSIFTSGPIFGLFWAWIFGGNWLYGMYTTYLIEGGSFAFVLITKMVIQAKEIFSGAPLGIKLILPIFLIGCLGGFVRSIDFEFLVKLYSSWFSLLGLLIAIAVSCYSLLRSMLVNQYNQRKKAGYHKEMSDQKDSSFSEGYIVDNHGSPWMILTVILGFLTFGFHPLLLKWEWLMNFVN